MIIDGAGVDALPFGSAHIDCQGDHRIAMAFAVAGLRAAGTITIEHCEFVDTSFPGFAALASGVGLRIAQEKP